MALVFAREVTPALTGLVKQLDAAVAAHADRKLTAVVILLTDDDKAEAKLKELAEKEKVSKVVLAVESPQGPPKYNIAKDADLTVVVYEKKKVKKNLAFPKGHPTDAEVGEVVTAVKDVAAEKPDAKK